MMFLLVDGHNFPHSVAAARPLKLQTIHTMKPVNHKKKEYARLHGNGINFLPFFGF